MSIKPHIYEIETYGFTVLEGAIDKNYLELLRAEFDSPDKNMFNLVAKKPLFFELIDLPGIIQIVESILSPDIILAFLNGRSVLPLTKAQQLHSDIPFQIVNREKTLALNVAFLIDDFTESNGATVILPLSHRLSVPVPSDTSKIKYLHKIVAPAGSAIVFNANCWHGSSENITPNPRRSIFAQYRVSYWTRFQFNPHNGFDKEWLHRLSARQKKLLRMEHGVGFDNSADVF